MRQAILAFPPGAEGAALVDRRVAGLSLLDRQVRTLARAGIEHISALLPAGATPRLSALTRQLPLQLEISTYGQAPVLPRPGGDYLLLLGEFVHHHSSLAALLEAGLGDHPLRVHATPHPGQPAALRAATAGLAPAAGGDGPFCSGAFLCSSRALPPRLLAEAGADPWQLLAEAAGPAPPLVRGGGAPPLWRRVDLPGGARAAKDMLFGQVTKKTSGFVSRHINARLSIPVSKFLVETGLSPHAITVLLVMTTGLGSAYLVSRATDYATLALAGLLWQLAAVFDRCDGEVARVRLCESKFGAWFDTVTDNIAYICAYIGLLVGMHRRFPQEPHYLYLGLSAIAALLLTLLVMYSYARKTGSGSLQHYLRALSQEIPAEEKGWVQKLMERYGFVAKRDFFSFYLFLACLADQIQLAYWFLVAILHLAAAGVLLSQRKMMRSHSLHRLQRLAGPAVLEKRR